MSGLPTEFDVLRDVAGRLDAAGIGYMLTGSLAMSIHAAPRMTRDIDFVVELSPADASRISELFGEKYYIPDNMAESIVAPGMFNLMHFDTVTKVDFVVRKSSAFRIAEFERRRRVTVGDFEISIVSREDLILSKLLWAKDSGSEQQRRDVCSLLITPHDRAYVSDWAATLGVLSLLHELDA